MLKVALANWVTLAWAEGGAAPGGIGGQGGVAPFIPFLVILAIFYFLIIRPQQKKAKLQQKFLTELKKGDRVITNGGIIGTIRNISERFVSLEIDDGNGVCMKILRSQILESAANLKDAKPA